ncbi:MAG: hypothetical protein LBT84_03205 [Spirochaetia bacterium]|nr:hypothetical protein [Spirochaetia bacterium]
MIRDRKELVAALRDADLEINREGKDYISVKDPVSGQKLRFKGGIYAEAWTPKAAKDPKEETEQARREETLRTVARLEQELERVLEKRMNCNHKRYPAKWVNEANFLLSLPKKEALSHDRDGTDAEPDPETDGGKLHRQTDGLQHPSGKAEGKPDAFTDGITSFEEIVQRCKRSVHELADIVGKIEKRRVEREEERACFPSP